MALIRYKDFSFTPTRWRLIQRVTTVVDEYQRMGYQLTLRQLYYQFVSRGWIANKDQEYKRLGSVVNDGRLAGHIDWDAIADRTRNVRRLPTWDNQAAVIRSAADWFKTDRWANQDHRIEVWIEKDALIGVIERVCDELRVPCFACRGYVSQSEMHAAGLRFHDVATGGQTPVLLHLGDHDPSGIDMSRDNEERTRLFMSDPDGGDSQSDELVFERLALSMKQIEAYKPPPNPAKMSDIRYKKYVAEQKTTSSWELDALNPEVIAGLVRQAVLKYQQKERWEQSGKEEERMGDDLRLCESRWAEVERFLHKPKPKRKPRKRRR
jgi:hypothetical protein